MDLKIAISFSWLILLAFLARPVCMQVYWNATSVCSATGVRDPTCFQSDPTHQWDVDLPDCSADSVRVVYSNYEFKGNEGNLQFQEIRLHCTAPEGTAQAELMPSSVNCSGIQTGGTQSLGFVFQDLTAADIQPGWTCTIRGCYRIGTTGNNYVKTPLTEFVVGDCDRDPTTTAEVTPEATTTPASPTTTSPTTTDADPTSTDSNTEISESSEGTHTNMATTDTATPTGAQMYIMVVIPVLLTVLLVMLFVITLVVFAALSRRKLQRDRKRTILIFDEKNMVFDPDYVPAVNIEKPLSHRFSVVSNDFLQFLTPLNNGGLHGNEKMTILLEGSPDGGDNVLLHLNDTASHIKAMDTNYLPQEFSGSGTTQVEDPPPDYSSVCHSELSTHHGEVSGYLLESNRQSNVALDGHSVTLHETKWSESLDVQSRDSSSLFLPQAGPNRNVEAGSTNLDKHYNSSSGGYVDSNMSTLITAPQSIDNQPESGNIFELGMESDGSDNKPPFSSSVMKSTATTSYVDSALFGTHNTHHDKTLNLDSLYFISDDSGVSSHSNLSTPRISLHDHTTDTDGYVSDGQNPPTDKRRSSEQDESLELDFVTESDGYSTGEDRDEHCLVSPTFQDQNQSSTSLTTPSKNIDLSSPDDSVKSQTYVTCDDITSSEPLMRKITVSHSLTPSLESDPKFVVHLDFDGQTDTSQDPVLLSGSGMKISTDMPNFEHKDENYLQVPVTGGKHLLDDNSQEDDSETGQYIVYDFQPMRHLLSDNSGTDCLSAIVPERQSSDEVKLQPLLAYYPSDASSGYVSGSVN